MRGLGVIALAVGLLVTGAASSETASNLKTDTQRPWHVRLWLQEVDGWSREARLEIAAEISRDPSVPSFPETVRTLNHL
jgi:hypothetical protein